MPQSRLLVLWVVLSLSRLSEFGHVSLSSSGFGAAVLFVNMFDSTSSFMYKESYTNGDSTMQIEQFVALKKFKLSGPARRKLYDEIKANERQRRYNDRPRNVYFRPVKGCACKFDVIYRGPTSAHEVLTIHVFASPEAKLAHVICA